MGCGECCVAVVTGKQLGSPIATCPLSAPERHESHGRSHRQHARRPCLPVPEHPLAGDDVVGIAALLHCCLYRMLFIGVSVQAIK